MYNITISNCTNLWCGYVRVNFALNGWPSLIVIMILTIIAYGILNAKIPENFKGNLVGSLSLSVMLSLLFWYGEALSDTITGLNIALLFLSLLYYKIGG